MFRSMKVLKEHILESVLITGCNKGIGLQFVKHFVEANKMTGSNTQIFACSRRHTPDLDELLTDENVHHVDLDISKSDEVKSAALKVEQILDGKGLNLLVNNAAIQSYNKPAGVHECSPKEMTEVFNVNVSGTHSMTMAFHPLLKLSASQRSDIPMCCARGAVFNISSKLASVENTDKSYAVSYRVSKTALNMLTKITSLEFIADGIISLSVQPGWVQTDIGDSHATLTATESVADMVYLIENAKEEHNGQFVRKNFVVDPY